MALLLSVTHFFGAFIGSLPFTGVSSRASKVGFHQWDDGRQRWSTRPVYNWGLNAPKTHLGDVYRGLNFQFSGGLVNRVLVHSIFFCFGLVQSRSRQKSYCCLTSGTSGNLSTAFRGVPQIWVFLWHMDWYLEKIRLLDVPLGLSSTWIRIRNPIASRSIGVLSRNAGQNSRHLSCWWVVLARTSLIWKICHHKR